MKLKRVFKNKVFANVSWLVFGKIAQSLINLFISMFTARYLGPSNFGIINYAASVVTFCVPLVNLGLENVLVYQLKKNPENEGKILGSAMCISAFSFFLCLPFLSRFVSILNSDSALTVTVTILYSFTLLLQVLDFINYWFQAKLLSKYSSVVSLIAYLVMALYKIYLLVTNKSVEWFAISNSLDYLIIFILLFIIYKKKKGRRLQFSSEVAFSLLSFSKSFIIPSIMIVIYGQTDKIMLKHLINESATGYYSAAFQCASVIGFVYSAIITSFKPVIFKLKESGMQKEYEEKTSLLYGITMYLSIFQGIVMTIFSSQIIKLLYGSAYLPSAAPLLALSWYQAFSYFGLIKDAWALAENKQKYLWIFYTLGAILNIILNFILIPLFGITGAAVATLITQFFVNVVLSFLFKPFKENSKLVVKGLNPLFIFRCIKSAITGS